jgi:hypothetical protein
MPAPWPTRWAVCPWRWNRLRLAAFLAPDDIPRALADAKSKCLAEAVRTLADEEKAESAKAIEAFDTETALVELAGHSMITLEPAAFSCHRLVQAVQSDRLTDELRRRWTALAARWVNEAVPSVASDVRSWPVMESLRAHIETVTPQADRLAIAEPTARLINQLGLFLLAKALYQEAEPLLRRVVKILEDPGGEPLPNYASAFNNLAQLLKATNRLGEAEPLMRRGAIIFRKFGESTGYEHPHMRAAVGNYATLLKTMGLPVEEIQRRGNTPVPNKNLYRNGK